RTPAPTNNVRLELGRLMLSLGDYALKQRKKTPGEHRAHYNSVISLCIANRALREGRHLRSHMARIGYTPGLFLDNQFINLYARCGELGMARELFDEMPERNVVSWNALISGYFSNGRLLDALFLFCTMVEAGPSPNHLTYLTAIRASVGTGSRELGKQIHGHLMKAGLFACVQVGNCLISMYSEFGEPENAESVYRNMVERDEVSWNSLIALHVKSRSPDDALALLVDMQKEGFTPDEFTFGSLLSLTDANIITKLHGQIAKRGLANNVFVGSVLLDAYARSGNPRAASLVFNSMQLPNAVTWNSVISACFGNNMVQEGLKLFRQMGEQGVLPDEYTVSILLKAGATCLSIIVGKQLHGLAIKMGLHADALIGNSLITMYAKHEEVSDSWKAFSSITEPDLISWNSIVQSHVQNEEPEQALTLFVEIKGSGFEPDEFSFVGALAACASLAWYRTGREVHGDLVKRSLAPDAFIGSALIDMYAKSMVISDAREVFNRVEHKDLITWNAMISGLAQNGYLDEVLKLLYRMREENIKPDNFTFASIFAACANAMAMQQGRQVHGLVLKSEHKTDAAVANSLITMYCRAGNIREARKVFSELSVKNVISWTAMIGGCVQSGYSREALEIFEQMEIAAVRPNAKTFIAVLTACSYAGLRREAGKFFKMMETKYGIRPGFNHYSCMIDILGRAGKLKQAENLIEGMPFEPDALVWRILLSACRIHGDAERGRRAMEKILALEPGDSAAYVLLSNLYASLGNWDGVEEVRQMMRVNGVKKEPGKSWLELNAKVHEFMAGDSLHPQKEEICLRLRELLKQMKDEGYIPGIEHADGTSLDWSVNFPRRSLRGLMAVAIANAFGTSQQLRHRPSGPPSLPHRPFAGRWRLAISSHDEAVTEKLCLLGAAVASQSVGNSSKQLAGKRRVFFLDVNPLCFDGSRPSLRSFARWLDLFFSEVSLRDPVIAVLDGEEGNEYRRHLLPSYKAHRKRYLRQSRVLRSAHDTYQSTTECKVIDVLLKCNVPVVKVHGYEADDVVATLTDQVLKKGARVVIGSPDKDFKQLISEDVQIVMPMPDFGRWSFYTLRHYIDQYNCDPSSDLSLRCFIGDEVDGVPGIQQLVPGFGRKTALKLLKKHGSLEDLLSAAAIRTVGKDYAQNALTKYADYLRRNYKVLSLRRDVNVQLQDDWLSERNTSNDLVILSNFLRKLGERPEGQKLNNRHVFF
ncbi:unnamed protein product, partial [Musa acuminata var. zebrina]